jgi:CHAT domain-containing protein
LSEEVSQDLINTTIMRKLLYALLLSFFLLFMQFIAPCSAEDKPRALLQKAVISFEHSNYAAALKGMDECLALAEKAGDRQLTADAHLWRARLFAEQRLYRKARDDARLAEKEYEVLKDGRGVFSSRIIILEYLSKRRSDTEAMRYLHLLEKDLHALTAPDVRADFFLVRGTMFLSKDNYDLAGKNYDEALRLAGETRDSRRDSMARYCQSQRLASQREFSKAAECCARAMESAEKAESPYLVALAQQGSGGIAERQGHLDEAALAYSSAIEIYRLCGNIGMAGRALARRGALYVDRGQWDQYRASLRKALDLCFASANYEQVIDSCRMALIYTIGPLKKEDSLTYLELLHRAAELTGDTYEKAWAEEIEGDSYQMRDQEKAQQAYMKAMKLYREAHDSAGELRMLVMKSNCLLLSGKPEESLACLNKALPLSEEADHQGSREDRKFVSDYSPGAIYRRAGMACLIMEHYNDALKYYDRALAYDMGVEEPMLRITDRQGIIVISNYAYDIERARREVTKALEEAAAMKEPYERAAGYNIIINGLLNSSTSMGSTKGYDRLYSMKDTLSSDIVKSIYDDPRLYRQIVEGYREWIAQGKERKSPIEEGIPHMLLGFFYFAGGKSAEAHDEFELSLEPLKRGKFPLFTGIVHFLLGLNSIHEGRKEEGKKSIEESLRCFAQQGDKKNQATIGGYLGLLCRDMGNMDESLACYEKALHSARETGNRRIISAVLVGMGYTYYQMKRYDEAAKCYNDALALQEECGNRKERALTYLFLGRMEMSRQAEKSAVDYYERAFKGFKDLGRVFDMRDVALELGEIHEKSGGEQEALNCYLEALGGLIEVRSRIGEKYSGGNQSDSTKKLFERAISLLIKARRYDEALKYFGLSGSYDLFSGVDISTIDMRDEKMKKLVDEMGALSRKMKLLQNELESVQRPDREKYLAGELASTKQQFLAVTNEIKERNPDYGQMIAIQSPELAQLQPVIPPDTLLLQYYPSEEGLYIFVVSRDSFAIRHVDVPRARLYDLIRQLRSGLDKTGVESESCRKTRMQLYDFLLRPVQKEIDEKAAIEVIPAGLLWYVPFEILEDQQHTCLIDRKAVGYLYSSNIVTMLAAMKKNGIPESRLVLFGNPEGADLPGAGLEVAEIGKLFPSSLLFTGKEATSETFREKAPLGTILHIATHSILNRDDINNSYIQFAGDRGHFSLGEIYGLALPETRLVVLSSCQSALGSDNPGREFASLASAFMVAGAPAVIASLWRADDASSALLFKEFYGNLKKGMGKAESLRQAKIALKGNAATASPHYWSSFILLGDWR